jgi:hypothetical protein
MKVIVVTAQTIKSDSTGFWLLNLRIKRGRASGKIRRLFKREYTRIFFECKYKKHEAAWKDSSRPLH